VIRVVLPAQLRALARIDGEVTVAAGTVATQDSVLDALEQRFPVLQGAIRDRVTRRRRPFVRFFACERDLSHDAPDAPLPEPVTAGTEPFLIIGAMSGG
jgi:sulfur-carrier protein